MTDETTAPELSETVSQLRAAGATFAYLHGSRAGGTATRRSDVDVAAWFPTAIDTLELRAVLPGHVDLLVLNDAPLELAGRVALRGRLLFEDDPPRRVAWEATTRKIYLDERPRIQRARETFVRAWRDG